MKSKAETKLWRSAEHLDNTIEFRRESAASAPVADAEVDSESGISRRNFLQLMGASTALAGLTGCRKPVEHIVPYVQQPEEFVPGRPVHYATTMVLGEEVAGLLVESHEGRPTKIEPNPEHPYSLGGAHSFHQAAVLNLYDPDRAKGVTTGGGSAVATRDELTDVLATVSREKRTTSGRGLAVLSPASVSPSYAALAEEFGRRFPQALWATYEPISNENIDAGVRAATGDGVRPLPHFDKAKVILALDSDFLLMDGSGVRNTRQFSAGRQVDGGGDVNRLYVVESGYTVTGGMADHRLRMRSADGMAFLGQLIAALRDVGVSIDGVPAIDASATVDGAFVSALAQDLKDAGRQHGALIVAGRRQPAAVHAVVCALNHALGGTRHTVDYVDPVGVLRPSRDSLGALVGAVNAGDVDTLVILGGNPSYNAPSDLRVALDKVKTTIHLSPNLDQTGAVATWHVGETHFLEAWGDARAADGTVSVIQPLIAPLYDTFTALELLNLIVSGEFRGGHDIVREQWRSLLPSGDERAWRKVLHDGFLAGSQYEAVAGITIDRGSLARVVGSAAPPKAGTELVFAASSTLYDGRFANNSWLQELPDPVTKLVWDNAAIIGPAMAEKLGIATVRRGDAPMIKIDHGGATLELPAFVLPGQADDTITVDLGYGQKGGGIIANVQGNDLRDGPWGGFDAYSMRTSTAPDFATGVAVTVSGAMYPLSTTQNHDLMSARPGSKERPFIRESSIGAYREHGAAALHPHPPVDGYLKPTVGPVTAGEPVENAEKSLWNEHRYDDGPQWGMTIDLATCTGCNACVTACQSENNIPVVGKKNAGYGREMHWIRLDRYFKGDDRDDPEMRVQPVPCMHCENAPCEQVCPVTATSHTPDGLNGMTYNRCIGTRYCLNNCPYKVRRFNYFNYTNDGPETRIRETVPGGPDTDVQKMTQNPDVTVRFRGVMEKCTYCVQRISQARIDAKVENRPLADGDVTTACQQSCPAGSIVFGDIRDGDSQVSTKKQSERDYVLLGETYTRPRTSYLAKVSNPHPSLAAPEPQPKVASGHGGHGGHDGHDKHDNHGEHGNSGHDDGHGHSDHDAHHHDGH